MAIPRRGRAGRPADAGKVFIVPPQGRAFTKLHDREARRAVAARLAALKGLAFGGDLTPGEEASSAYLVPAETLTSEAAARLGITCEDDLFGGVVPTPFVASKAITHGLVRPGATAPHGWCDGVGTVSPDAVLAGYTAFARNDAREAGARLLDCGSVRLKLATAVGGRGQEVTRSPSELDRMLGKLDWAEAAVTGVVVEENLEGVTTFSVGQVRVSGVTVSYFGVQRQSSSDEAASGYGGSGLLCVPAGFRALAELDLPADARTAIAQAEAYDLAAERLYPDFFASRRNYDVAVGRRCDGTIRSGVLEQSWRIGGASGAEILALEAFMADPGLPSVKVGTFEIFGDSPPVPVHAFVLFSGTDPDIGPLTKYAAVLT